MEDIIFLIRGTRNGEPFSAEMYQGGEHPFFSLRWKEDDGLLRLRVVPKDVDPYGEPVGSLTLESVSLSFPWTCRVGRNRPEHIFMNGYQSWTACRELTAAEKEETISKFAAEKVKTYYLDRYGDYRFTGKPQKAGQFHGFTYCYFRDEGAFRLLGSLSERDGFTVFYYDASAQRMTVEKDCAGLVISEEWNAFDLYEILQTEKVVFKKYFEQMGIPKPAGKPMTGYTSWYRHYQDISQEILTKDLESIRQSGQTMDVFQIDDGYQAHVGDWLEIHPQKFPDGLEPMVEAIHSEGMKAGLWLAPFVCEKDSQCYREHPDWLLREEDGTPVCCGSNWSTFFALDLEQEAVRMYLREVFHQVLDVWGFDLVKLDFLYAACMLPSSTKTRGQKMCEAMDFLRELVGEKLILACGVPLGAAFGKVEYCRIGPDVGLDWNGTWKDRLLHRERVSTKHAIGNTIYRRQLNGKAFWNDPDVYLLRGDDVRLSEKQKTLLAKVNGLFGGVLFTSDDIGQYDEEQKKLRDMLPVLGKVPCLAERRKGKMEIHYEYEGEDQMLKFRL